MAFVKSFRGLLMFAIFQQFDSLYWNEISARVFLGLTEAGLPPGVGRLYRKFSHMVMHQLKCPFSLLYYTLVSALRSSPPHFLVFRFCDCGRYIISWFWSFELIKLDQGAFGGLLAFAIGKMDGRVLILTFLHATEINYCPVSIGGLRGWAWIVSTISSSAFYPSSYLLIISSMANLVSAWGAL
jgi:hypothetical protein